MTPQKKVLLSALYEGSIRLANAACACTADTENTTHLNARRSWRCIGGVGCVDGVNRIFGWCLENYLHLNQYHFVKFHDQPTEPYAWEWPVRGFAPPPRREAVATVSQLIGAVPKPAMARIISGSPVLKLSRINESKTWQLPTTDTKSVRKNWPKSVRKKTSLRARRSAKAQVRMREALPSKKPQVRTVQTKLAR